MIGYGSSVGRGRAHEPVNSRPLRKRQCNPQPGNQWAQSLEIAISRDYNPAALPCLHRQQRVILPARAEPRRPGPSENRTGTPPRRSRRGNNSPASFESFKEDVVEHPPRFVGACPGCQLGRNNAGEHRRGESPAEKRLQSIQIEWLTERVNEDVRIEGVDQPVRRIGSMVASPPTATS